MTAHTYQKLIHEGIKGLPTDSLAQIVDFIFFLRKRSLQPKEFEEELYTTLLFSDLKQLNRDEVEHLEKEFNDYDRFYPRE